MAEKVAIYNFEDALESAFKSLLTAEEIACRIPNDEPEQQYPRPRVDLFLQVGGETGHYHTAPRRADIFEGTITTTIISNTKPGEVGTSEHSEFRAMVRAVMADSRDKITLENHILIDVVETGTSPSYEGQDGYYESSITFAIKFAVKPDVWPE